MAAKFPLSLPAFSVSSPLRSSTEICFSRWNNANAEPFLRQKNLEDDLRRRRRHESADRIAENLEDASGNSPPEFRSRGTPSSPSRSSIPGRKSKYSQPERANPMLKTGNPRISLEVVENRPEIKAGEREGPRSSHPALKPRNFNRVERIPLEVAENCPEIRIGENGLAYRIGNAPFEFQYSYTESPKVKPLALREPPYLPFGPSTMARPWTGRAPLSPSKKKLPEFDSFRPPPPGKKGVKPVQSPGPFVAGAGPNYEAGSREDIIGDPLTREEVIDLIKGCVKTKRQLNIGRDGLTHNMLDNIHAHWKRRRVCKIKCKGVCTVDMDNVREQLEEKTGGKVIFNRGGVIFLFRGRNYNYRTRPKFPLMLWKPIPPVYPRLVQRVPEGLTLEEATEMRKIGRQLTPIYKLGKNGVYCNLVRNVREAFEECELVRIDCQGLNKSDTRKIGAKLKDLVPCTLLSFEFEQILIWRGRNWKSSFPPLSEDQIPDQEIDSLVGSTDSTDEENLSDLVGEITSEEEDSVSELEADADIESSALLSTSGCLEEVRALLNRAIEEGSAVILLDEPLDADLVKERAVQLGRTAPAGRVFKAEPKKPSLQKVRKVKYQSKEEKSAKNINRDLEDDVEEMSLAEIERSLRVKKGQSGRRREQIRDRSADIVPLGSLGVDELAKLLS